MSQVSASQTYDELKALLFESENKKLSDLAESLEQHVESTQARQSDLASRLDALFQRTGDNEKLTQSVAEVLAEALRKAEVENHDRLANAVAPVVVRTIRTELTNSKDEMVEALYPITGRLVKAYVTNAIRDLSRQLNSRIEQNTFLLRLSSLLSGRSAGEVALAHANDFQVLEVYLIRHDTGALLARWPEQPTDSHDHALSGALSAINAFANEALAASNHSLRQIDIGDESLYLRASPIYLVAVRCSGSVPEEFAETFDEAFLRALEKHNSNPTANAQAFRQTVQQLSTEFSDHLDDAAAQGVRKDASMQLLKSAAALILMPILLFAAYSIISNVSESYYRSQAKQALQPIKDLSGYPVNIATHPFGRTMSITGLAPSAQVQQQIGERLRERFPNTAIATKIAVVPGSEPPHDFTPDIDRLATQINVLGSQLSQQQIIAGLAQLRTNLQHVKDDVAFASKKADSEKAPKLNNIATAVTNVQKLTNELGTGRGDTEVAIDDALRDLNKSLNRLRYRLIQANSGGAAISNPSTSANIEDNSNVDYQLGAAISGSDQLAALSSLLAVNAATPPTKPTPLELLQQTIRHKAIFFSEGADYLKPTEDTSTLDLLAKRIRGADTIVRVVGYTDSVGDDASNVDLSVNRAKKVRRDLLSRGVPARLLKITGRRNLLPISENASDSNANRRVEFELTYDGEPQQ